jgi:glycosyltransferase involved in cell wall biosynthesis
VAELISIILTTYNREDALDAVLRSLATQFDRDFEIIVADDGSGPTTKAVIDEWRPHFAHGLIHAWHEDDGFRAAEARNRAIKASHGWYCIFLDGDCIVRRDFVAQHRALAEQGWFVSGNRVLLSPALTLDVLQRKLTLETWPLTRWLAQRLAGGVNRIAALLTLPLGPLRKLRPKQWTGIRSANLAVWRADLDAVDGFDADYRGWGKEDSDIVVRLLRAGVRRKDGNFATGVLHLWHAEAPRAGLADNEQKLGVVVGTDRVRALRGISAL